MFARPLKSIAIEKFIEVKGLTIENVLDDNNPILTNNTLPKELILEIKECIVIRELSSTARAFNEIFAAVMHKEKKSSRQEIYELYQDKLKKLINIDARFLISTSVKSKAFIILKENEKFMIENQNSLRFYGLNSNELIKEFDAVIQCKFGVLESYFSLKQTKFYLRDMIRNLATYIVLEKHLKLGLAVNSLLLLNALDCTVYPNRFKFYHNELHLVTTENNPTKEVPLQEYIRSFIDGYQTASPHSLAVGGMPVERANNSVEDIFRCAINSKVEEILNHISENENAPVTSVTPKNSPCL